MSLSLKAADNSGTSGFAFLKLPTGSARFQALGNNGVSLLEGSEAMSINPSAIAFAQMKEVGFSMINWLEDYDGKYISYVEPHGTNVIGVNLGYYSTDGFDVRDKDGVPINAESVKFKNMLGSLTLAKSFFMERFALGISGKYVSEDRYLTKENKFVIDWGAILKLSRKISFGFSQQNITGDNKKIVGVMRYGASLSLSNYITVTADNRKYTDTEAKTGFGIELTLPEELLQYGKFVFRAGYNNNGNFGKNYDDSTLEKLGLSSSSNWSFGIGIYSAQSLGKSYSLEYALTPYGELGKTSQISFKLQF
jgi:hypothetical protein